MNFEQDAHEFLQNIFRYIDQYEIDSTIKSIDHLCFRTSSLEEYVKYKSLFSNFGQLLIESEVNGRDIATFKLNTPLKFRNYSIPLLEVPAPKAHKVTERGFEHIEIVTDISFVQLTQNYSHLKLVKKGLAKIINPELEVEFESCAIKWHHQSLEDVIRAEKTPLIWQKVLELEASKTGDFINLEDHYQALCSMGELKEQELIEKLKDFKPL